MVTPSLPVQTKGTSMELAPSASVNSVLPPSGTKPAWWVGAWPPWLTQPLCATKKLAGSVANTRTGALLSSAVLGYFSRSAWRISPPSRTSLSTSVVTVTVGEVAGVAALVGVVVAPTLGAVGTVPGALAVFGMLASVATAAVAVSAWAGGAAFSLPHSIHSRVATISQAKIRKSVV